jgi:hypothetical protein
MDEAAINAFWLNVVPRWQLGEMVFFISERRIADLIGDGPMALEEVAAKAKLHPDSLRRVLDVLASYGVFTREGEDRYSNNAMSGPLRSDTPNSQRAYFEIGRKVMNEAWMDLAHVMETGECGFDHRFGAGLFDYLKQHPDVESAFGLAMTATVRRVESALAAATFGDFKVAVDVGGNLGALVRLLLAKNPKAQGWVFDSPDVIANAERSWAGAPDADRLKAMAGDFFESVPKGGDLYLLKFILHDWQDEACVAILRNVRAAMGAGARLAIIETVLPEDNSRHFGWDMDVNMMLTTGGRERPLSAYIRLLEQAGLKFTRMTATSSPVSIVEAALA